MSEFERQLRHIMIVWSSRNKPVDVFAWMKNLNTVLENAEMFLQEVDACQFKEENGNGCLTKAVRESYGINCCEEHAARRDRYFS